MKTQDVKRLAGTYLQHGLNLTFEEQEIRDNLQSWLPSQVIDFHSHIGISAAVGEIPDRIRKMTKSTFVYASATMHRKIRKKLFPSLEISQVAIAFPYHGVDFKKSNAYIAKLALRDVSFLPFCTGDARHLGDLLSDWDRYHFCGIKMYPAGDGLPEKIMDVFPKTVLRLADNLNSVLIMHLPKPLRFSLDEMIATASEYPRAVLVLAHMGVEKVFSKELSLAYLALAKHINVYLDTSMVINEDVMKCAMEILGPHRLLFATDQPLNLLRLVPVSHPTLGLRYMTDYPYHWVDPKEQDFYNNSGFIAPTIQVIWGMLLAIKAVIEESFGGSSVIKELVFRENARKILGV